MLKHEQTHTDRRVHSAERMFCSLSNCSRFFYLRIILQTLEKISEEFPSSIVRENGLAALLNYLDFSIAVQQTALQERRIVAVTYVPPEHFQMIRGV